ncbi:MAG: T9SS type A sorting domain-containing protein [Bacteroidota bacterium]|nr:T9SS type A sorting domain-containing protein [Bacteroidota bacterium]
MRKLILLLLIIVGSELTFAQISLVQADFSPAGEVVTSESITAITNFGEVVKLENSNELLQVSEGFIHPEMLILVSNLSYTLDWDISVFPNPTIDHVYLDGIKNSNCQFRIVNELGSNVLLLIQPVSEDIVKIDLSHLVTGVYYLTVTFEQKQLTYKIIKQ